MRISVWSSDVCSSDLVGADIGEATLIGRLALRIGIGAAQVELDPVEIEFGDELRIDQLAFVPRRILLHDVAVGLVAVGAEAEARLFQRVADIEVRPAELVVAKLEPEAEQAVDDDAVVGDDAVYIGRRLARPVGFERKSEK